MKTKHFLALVAMFVLLAFSANALADTTLTVTVKNKAGVKAPGTVYATKSGTVKTCNASDGDCNLTLTTGTWNVYAKNAAGGKTPAKTKAVVAGTNTLVVQYP